MKDRTLLASSDDLSIGSKSAVNVAERRSAPRKHFVAETLIVEVSSGLRLAARSCDLVISGCYVDTLRPFPVGTLVRIRMKKDETTVEANGNVVYELPGLGMGIAFHDLTPEGHAVIDKWLSHMPLPAASLDSLDSLLPPAAPELPPAPPHQPSPEFVELVRLLKQKGIVTSSEAASLLKDNLE